MSFWEALALTGTMATILGIALTVYGIINNRTFRAEMRAVREILDRIERGQEEARREMAEAIKYLADLIVAESERTRQTLRGSP